MSVMGNLVKSGRTEVTDKLRKEVNKIVKSYVDQEEVRIRFSPPARLLTFASRSVHAPAFKLSRLPTRSFRRATRRQVLECACAHVMGSFCQILSATFKRASGT